MKCSTVITAVLAGVSSVFGASNSNIRGGKGHEEDGLKIASGQLAGTLEWPHSQDQVVEDRLHCLQYSHTRLLPLLSMQCRYSGLQEWPK